MQQLPVAAALYSMEKNTSSKPGPQEMDKRKKPSEGEEYAESLLGYEKIRTDPTVVT